MSGEPIFSIFLRGEPVPAARPRVTRNRTYNTARYHRWKSDATRLLAAAWGPHVSIEMGVAVSIEVVLPRPKTKPRSGQHALYWHPTEDYPMPIGGKWGDLDNYCKSVLDAMQAARILTDDCIVVELAATKHAGSDPGIHIMLSLVDPDQ